MKTPTGRRSPSDRPTMSRRVLLRRSPQAALAAAALLASTGRTGAGLNANEQVRIGWIGCGLRCRVSLPAFLSHPDARIVALCDVNRSRAELASKLTGGSPDLYGDYRRLLERKDIDAVVVATCEHWKCLPTVAACQAEIGRAHV